MRLAVLKRVEIDPTKCTGPPGAVAAEVLAKPIAQELLGSSTRLAYVGVDGDPRVVPVAFLWTGSRLVLGTVSTSAKVPALRRNPRPPDDRAHISPAARALQ